MANINKLSWSFVDNQTTIYAEHMNGIVGAINSIIDALDENSGSSSTPEPTPTPETVATPTISISGTTATISCSTSGATIYYTTNGNTPTTSSTQYSSPITLSEACTIKAIAVKGGMNNSQVASQPYTPAVTDITSLFTASTWTTGAIKHADGGTQSSSTFEYCDFLDISTYAGKVLNYSRMERANTSANPVGLAFYDSSEQYISGQGLHGGAEDGWEDYDCEIPSNAKYIRMSWYNATGGGAEWHDDLYVKIKEPTE